MRPPVSIGDYTDFFASRHHATNVGSLFRTAGPLAPNYQHVPPGQIRIGFGECRGIIGAAVAGLPFVRN